MACLAKLIVRLHKSAFLLALMILGASALAFVPAAGPVTAAPLYYSRGGTAAVGPKAQPVAVADRLHALNLSWYYDYSARLDDEPAGAQKVAVLRGGETNRTPLDRIAAQARLRPGHYWIIFNEPDLEGQDRVSDQFLASRGQQRFDYYAQLYHDYALTLKQADPSARLVAPNLFNWEGGFRSWLDGFRSAYRTRYGAEPPVDVWGLHLYSFDPGWKTLPMVDLDYSKSLYRDFREYVRAIPGHQSTPIWATELGTIWGYRDIFQGSDSLYRGNSYAWPEVTAYLADLIPWLEQEGVDRWFLFGTNPAPDPWAGVANALYLLDDAGQPTEAGRLLTQGVLMAQAQ
jgi:hypothetical protein